MKKIKKKFKIKVNTFGDKRSFSMEKLFEAAFFSLPTPIGDKIQKLRLVSFYRRHEKARVLLKLFDKAAPKCVCVCVS